MAALLSVVLVVSGCASAGVPEVPAGPGGQPDPVLVQGREVYSKRCANCHGGDGSGGQGPRITGELMVDTYPNLADQVTVITEGRKLMPGFGDALTPQEVRAVVDFIRQVL